MLQNNQLSYGFSLEETVFAIKLLRNDKDIVFKGFVDDAFARFVQHHGLTSHLYNTLFNPDLQSALRKLLKNQYFAVTIRNSQLFETFRVITQQFTANNIDFVPLKGSFLLPVFYKDLAGRGMSDIDILIESKDYSKVKDLLLKVGATQEVEIESDFLQDLGHHFPPFWLFNTSIEIHNRLLPANVRYNIPVEDVWKNLELYRTDELEIKGINTYLLLCYLSLHIYYSEMRGEYRIYWYLDIYKVIRSTPDFDFDKLNTWFVKYGIKKPVLDILAKVSYLFNMPIAQIKPLPKASIDLFHKNLSHQNNNSQNGYAVALERILYTKGILNKVRYVFHTIKFRDTNKDITFMQRVTKIGGRLIHYFYRSTFSILKR